MAAIDVFRSNEQLIALIGEGNAYLIWALGFYLEESDLEALASESLTDGPNDKKIDFIHLDRDAKRIVFAQGYYSTQATKIEAPANKASDLNTAAAWLFVGDLSHVPLPLQPVIQECREALSEGDVTSIELLYVHNLPESVNVNRELQTATTFIQQAVGDPSIRVSARELGRSQVEYLFESQDSHIAVKEEVTLPGKEFFTETGAKWKAGILSVSGYWLHQLYLKHGDLLFSANYRGFLGTKRRRINTGIRQSAESKPGDFWAFNNGVTLLTRGKHETRDATVLSGISIINGAQTTGSIGSIDLSRYPLTDVKILCRVIECTDDETIAEIVKYNNTQNAITTWDQYSNDPEQNRIAAEFKALGHSYTKKRGVPTGTAEIGIEEVAQPLLAFLGQHQNANRSKNQVFDRKQLYREAFEGKKANHILFVYALSRAIDQFRLDLKSKSNQSTLIEIENKQLVLLRQLKFKFFFISLVARCLEPMLSRPVDRVTIGFRDVAARFPPNTVTSLAASWTPIVRTILSFTVAQMPIDEFQRRYSEEPLLDEVVGKVGALLYVAGGNDSFAELIFN